MSLSWPPLSTPFIEDSIFVLSKDGVHMLIDVIIINWTCKSFFPHHALYMKIHYIGGNTSKRKK